MISFYCSDKTGDRRPETGSVWLPLKKICVLFLAAAVLCFPLSSGAEEKKTGILLMDAKGRVLFSQNRNTPLVPASTLKLLTCLAALEELGPDYRFPTRAFYDAGTHDLFVKGLGDPLFVSEAVTAFCRSVTKLTGLKEIRHIFLDQSLFDPGIRIPGTGRSLNPYDATTGALCANFNTVYFKWDKAAQTHVSAEPQTPLLDIFRKDIKASGLNHGRILLEPDQRLVYPGRLMRYFWEQAHIRVAGDIKTGPFPPSSPAAVGIDSPYPLNRVVQKLLKFSNNFIANQLMLTLGAVRFGPPATLEKGVRALKAFAAGKLGLPDIEIAEGSGISRKNRLTPGQMGRIVTAFKPFHTLLVSSENEYYKTGTLSDVRSRVGFIRGGKGSLYPFVIMVNEKGRGYKKILKDLKRRTETGNRRPEKGGG